MVRIGQKSSRWVNVRGAGDKWKSGTPGLFAGDATKCNEMQHFFDFRSGGQTSLPAMSCPRAGAFCRSGLARSRFCPSASVEPNCQRTNRPSPDVIRGDDRKLFPAPVIIHISDFMSIGAERISRFFLARMPRKCHKLSGGKGLRRVEKSARRPDSVAPCTPKFAAEVVGQYTSCGLP